MEAPDRVLQEASVCSGFRKQDLGVEFQGAIFVESGKEDTKELLRLSYRPKEPSWLIFNDSFLKSQEQSMLMCKELSKHGRKRAWINKKLLIKLSPCWKQG